MSTQVAVLKEEKLLQQYKNIYDNLNSSSVQLEDDHLLPFALKPHEEVHSWQLSDDVSIEHWETQKRDKIEP